MTLDKFVAEYDVQGKSQLLWINHSFDEEISEQSENTLKQAIARFEKHFSFVGITEYFDESLIILKHLFGWKTPYYQRKNIGKYQKSIMPSKSSIDFFNRKNKFDISLYSKARKDFENLLALIPDDIRKEIAYFKALSLSMRGGR
ncbi:MAG: hypothetical protein RAP03_04845 [Candidatus Electryonea clarkiae]|nr:hypothetical protein [Candidatus Electryonea clarkiae]